MTYRPEKIVIVPLRYKRLGYVAMNVSDTARTSDFLEGVLCLEKVGRSDDDHFFRCSANHHDIVITQDPVPGLRRIAWEMESAENLDLSFDHCDRIGLAPKWVKPEETVGLGIERAFRLREPSTGAEFEYFYGMRSADTPFGNTAANILRLGHVVLTAPKLDEAVTFVTENLNFRLSDSVGDFVALMRCWPNPYHHSFALSQSRGDTPGHHHVNFMVDTIDDIGRLFWRAKKFGAKIVFGPGRHPPSDSYCLYLLDPDNLMWEYSSGMEEFPETDARPPRILSTKTEDMDLWGAVPEPEFASPQGAIK